MHLSNPCLLVYSVLASSNCNTLYCGFGGVFLVFVEIVEHKLGGKKKKKKKQPTKTW